VSLADGRGNHEGRLRRHGQRTSRSRSRTNSRPHVGTAEDMRFLLPAVTIFSQLSKSAKRFCNYNKRLWIQEALTTNAAACRGTCARRKIDLDTPLRERDPVYGTKGGLTRLWRLHQ